MRQEISICQVHRSVYLKRGAFLVVVRRKSDTGEATMTAIRMWSKSDENSQVFESSSGRSPTWSNIYRRKIITTKETTVVKDI